MNISRLNKNNLHKLFVSVFGSIQGSARALGFSKRMIYNWIHGEKVDPQSVKRLTRNFNEAEERLKKLKSHLLDD